MELNIASVASAALRGWSPNIKLNKINACPFHNKSWTNLACLKQEAQSLALKVRIYKLGFNNLKFFHILLMKIRKLLKNYDQKWIAEWMTYLLC